MGIVISILFVLFIILATISSLIFALFIAVTILFMVGLSLFLKAQAVHEKFKHRNDIMPSFYPQKATCKPVRTLYDDAAKQAFTPAVPYPQPAANPYVTPGIAYPSVQPNVIVKDRYS